VFRSATFPPVREPSRNVDTPVCAVSPPLNSADKSVRVTKSDIGFMVAMRECKLVETFHELCSRKIAELRNSAIVLRSKFMVRMRGRKAVAFHEPCSRERVWSPGFSRSGALPAEAGTPRPEARRQRVHGTNVRPESEVETFHEPCSRERVWSPGFSRLGALPAEAGTPNPEARRQRVCDPDAPMVSWWSSPHVGAYKTCEL